MVKKENHEKGIKQQQNNFIDDVCLFLYLVSHLPIIHQFLDLFF